ncbi:hypothetical protein EUX98_g9144 [Antrodiella citrinella]|uniref:BED-type domain-containing protein n=1 Tax=Antrodiella citrinella TaxID=2447956 RepID=A0A4S4LZU3_9APHY|nr:hypothetical protein EUX98_g9144 [Antrodiella citrinella]
MLLDAPAPSPSPPLEEDEVFDLDNIEVGAEEDDYVDVPTAPGRHQPPRNARQAKEKGKAPVSPQRGPTTPRRRAKPAAPTRRWRQPQSTATPDKMITPRVQSVADKLPANSRVTALDIPFFFKRGDKNDRTATTDCKLCLAQIVEGKEPPSFQFCYRTITSNSGLRVHLRSKHAEIYRQTCLKEGWDSYILAKISSTVPQDSNAEVPEFTKEKLRNLLVRFIVRNDLSIRIIDSEELRAIVRLCRPTISDGDIPGRTKMRDLILHQFQLGFAHLKDEIAASLGKISFTTDI